MSLITCCPSCGTKFRVVADQLRISEGWVRCGRCQEVFDATQALEEMPLTTAAPVSASTAQPAPQEQAVTQPPIVRCGDASVVEAPQPPTSHPLVNTLPEPEPEPEPLVGGYELPAPPDVEQDEAWLDAPVAPDVPGQEFASIAQRMQSATEAKEPAWDEVLWTPQAVEAPALPDAPEVAPAVTAGVDAEFAQPDTFSEEVAPVALEEVQPATEGAPFGADVHAEQPAMQGPLEISTAAPTPAFVQPGEVTPLQPDAPLSTDFAPVGSDGDGDRDEAHEQIPEFVKQAQRKAWWSQPAVRFAMGMLVIFLPITLLLQVAIHERNTLAAWKPEWRPLLETLCVALRCELTPRKHIASVVLTGSSFAHEARPNHYRLDISIQNQSSLAVATPAVELTLTDAQDQVLVRKVLDLSEIGAPAELAARSEWNGTLPVMTQGLNLPVSGYRVMAFYP